MCSCYMLHDSKLYGLLSGNMKSVHALSNCMFHFYQTYRIMDQAFAQGVQVAVCSTSNEKAVCIISYPIP